MKSFIQRLLKGGLSRFVKKKAPTRTRKITKERGRVEALRCQHFLFEETFLCYLEIIQRRKRKVVEKTRRRGILLRY